MPGSVPLGSESSGAINSQLLTRHVVRPTRHLGTLPIALDSGDVSIANRVTEEFAKNGIE